MSTRATRRSKLKHDRRPDHFIAEALETRCMLSGTVDISEFMASNSTTLKDAAGDYPDWIEVHNFGSSGVNLNNYFLTDTTGNPEKWRFPVQTLAGGAYLVVFADSQDIAVAGQELHTNFNLSADGEYLALVNAADDSVAFAYSPQYPAQTTDVSYGIANANDPNSVQGFQVPTPGGPNNPLAATPVFSVNGEVFTGTLSVSLSDTTPGAVIHYTLDDSVPTSTSPTYSAPISLTKSTAIRAIAVASGFTNSPSVSQTYESVDSTVTSVQNQNLPVIILDTYGVKMTDTTDIAASLTVMNNTGGNTNILGTADYQGRAGVHIRGSTSESYPKQQYSIELWDETNNDKKAPLLGMPSQSDWVLYAPYTEDALMNNPLAYQLSNEMGHYASRTQYVELYLSTPPDTTHNFNTAAASTTTINYTSNYYGIYILEEKVKIDNNRVDVDEISATNPNGGYIVEQDRYSGEDNFTTPQGVHLVLNDPDDTSLESNISSSWDAFENALFTGTAAPGQPWDTPGNAAYYGNFINVGSFVDYYIMEELTRNIDAYWLSTYYNKAADTVVNGAVTQRGLISAGPVWDFNLAFGMANYNLSADAEGWDSDTISPAPGAANGPFPFAQDPYFQRLLQDPNFKQALTDRWDQLRQGVLSTASLMSDINANVATVSDNTGVYPTGQNPTGTTSPVMRNFQKWKELGVAVTTQGLLDPSGSWIGDVNLLKSWLTARVNWMDSQFAPEPVVTPGGNFGGTVSVTMSPVGPATTTDTQLIGPNSTILYTVPTTTDISNWQSLGFSTTGWLTGTTGLGYDTTTTGSTINYTPYISTNVASLMNGTTKRSSIYTRMTFTITDPSQIQALILKIQYDDGFIAWVNGVRVVDGNSPENTFSPSKSTAAGAASTFGNAVTQLNDSQAILYREFDISSVKNYLVTGTNVLAIQGLNYLGTGGPDDFLLAPTLYARKFTYPTVGAVYYTTDGSDPRTNTGAISTTAQLYSGAIPIGSDTKILARVLNGSVWGGLNTEDYDFDSTALRITEFMYNPPAPPAGSPFTAQDFEFIEVQNTSSSQLNLAGYTISDGVTFTFPSEFLAPGAYAVVAKNVTAFQTRYGFSPNVLGSYGGNFDNDTESVAISNGFGQVVEAFTYHDSWYKSTDGKGLSLVNINLTDNGANLSTAVDWRPSFVNLGAPGYPDNDPGTPHVTSALLDDSGSQPVVRMSFDSIMAAGSPGGVVITNLATNATVPVSAFLFDGSTATFTLASALASGVYSISLPASGAVNVSDTSLPAMFTFNVAIVHAGQTFSLSSLNTSVPVKVQQLLIESGGTLDVGSNSLIVDYTGASPMSMIAGLLQSGFNAGEWNGTGIASSAANADESRLTGLGYAEASDLGINSLGGVPVDSTAVVIRYTKYGDNNLDGTVDIGNDFGLLIDGLSATNASSWIQGDYTYDGKVDLGNDFNLFLRNYLGANTSAPAALPAAIAAPPLVIASPAIGALPSMSFDDQFFAADQ